MFDCHIQDIKFIGFKKLLLKKQIQRKGKVVEYFSESLSYFFLFSFPKEIMENDKIGH